MYRILLERSAEKDLGRLAHDLHDRIIAAIQKLAHNPGHPAAGNLRERKMTGAFASATIV
ncbi:MAG TPA: hypothetical protein VGM58_01965 [Verrucomicrobiae bacterium]